MPPLHVGPWVIPCSAAPSGRHLGQPWPPSEAARSLSISQRPSTRMSQHGANAVISSEAKDLKVSKAATLNDEAPYLAASSTKSTIRSSAQNRSSPPNRDTNPQCPPCSVATNHTRGFSSTRAAKNDTYGTNGSSCAVINNSGTALCRSPSSRSPPRNILPHPYIQSTAR